MNRLRSLYLKMIDNKRLKDSDIHNKACVDCRIFSKLRCDENYHVSRNTALSLAVALELNIKETNSLLNIAGYALSDSNMRDKIIKYCLKNKIYDLFTIDELLKNYDQ